MATAQMTVSPEDLSNVPAAKERIPEPTIIVIFGASGDLTKRKLLPALFHLEQNGLLPKEFAAKGAPASSNSAASPKESLTSKSS